jgi:hypothetical protein
MGTTERRRIKYLVFLIFFKNYLYYSKKCSNFAAQIAHNAILSK